jgi:putative DNA-invertase from lambdoid prophage Rac
MSNLFAYSRSAPGSQPTEAALVKALAVSGFKVQADDAVMEKVSIMVAVSSRPLWRQLLDRLYEGDVLIVSGIDSLGRDLKEVRSTVLQMARMGVRLHCLALGRIDLASEAGKATLHVLQTVEDFEQRVAAERASGTPQPSAAVPVKKPRGRPCSLTGTQTMEARQLLAAGASVADVASRIGTSRQTILRWNKRVEAEARRKA